MDTKFWNQYHKINEELKKYFLCVPPYQCVTGKFIKELKEKMNKKNQIEFKGQIVAVINNPAQRAYQMEYKYKKCKIFQPYLKVIEYATYDVFFGNWICAYMALLPVVEAVLRQWSIEEPELSFETMRKFLKRLITYLKKQAFYSDDRINITDEQIEFLRYILYDVFYTNFKAYENKKFSFVFNRNLTLHTLEGAMEESDATKNISSILLVLDIIAELYMMQNPLFYWDTIFYADLEKNLDYQLHWNLYKLISMKAIMHSDLNILKNMLITNNNDIEKERAIEYLRNNIVEKIKVS